MPASSPRVLIIGGGFGGLEAAKVFAGRGADVTLVDRNNHHLFQPLLYQVASAGLSPADIAIPIRGVLGDQHNVRILMAEVEDVDLDAKRAQLEDGDDIEFDYLIVAAGARTNYFGNDDWAQNSVGLKSIEDAIEVRRRVLGAFERAEREPDPERRRKLLTFVVIGGGPTGVELAGALSELNHRVLAQDFRSLKAEDTRVVLVELADRVLTGLHESLSEAAKQDLLNLSVEVKLGKPVKSIEQGRVILSDEIIPAETILWTAGVSPVPLAERLGVELSRGRIVVDNCCAIPGHPEAFAVGDIALFQGPNGPLPGVSPVAMQQGRYVARTILEDLRGVERRPFVYEDKGTMATIGRSRAVAEAWGFKFTGFMAWVAWLGVHLFYLVGFKNRVSVLLNWIWQYVVYRRGARLITRTWSPDMPDAEEPSRTSQNRAAP